MASINMSGDQTDQFYRYKRPKLEIKFMKGRTYLVNIREIADKFNYRSTHLIKFLAIEMSCASNLNHEWLSGKQPIDKLEKALDLFTKDLVLCRSCQSPDTQYFLERKKSMKICRACGVVKKVRTPHKILKHIERTPPDIPDDEFNVAGILSRKKTCGFKNHA